jgi:hypothetical protein
VAVLAVAHMSRDEGEVMAGAGLSTYKVEMTTDKGEMTVRCSAVRCEQAY